MNSTTQFTSITPSNITDARPGGTTPHMFTLNWAYPNDNYVVTKVQIYRYITGRTTGETTFDLTNQNYLIATITNNVTNTTSFVDDLTNYYSSNSSTLKNKYNDALTTSDQQLMDEIYYSRRGIIYGIVTSKSGATSTTVNATVSAGGFDTQPYVVIAHDSTGIVQCVSTKTQVKHNVLHLEGENIWATQLQESGGTTRPLAIGKVALDLDRVYLDTASQGPSGLGGWAWIHSSEYSTKSPGNVERLFRCSLRNGVLDSTYSMNCGYYSYNYHGGGIAIDAKTGSTIAATWTPIASGGGLFQMPIASTPGNYTATRISSPSYSAVNILDTGLCTSSPATPGSYWACGWGGEYGGNIARVVNSGAGTWTAYASSYTGVHKITRNSAIASGPDGAIFASTALPYDDMIYYISDTTISSTVSTLFLNRSNESIRSICADDDLLYPNNQALSGINGYSVWVANPEINLVSRAFFSKTTKALHVQNTDLYGSSYIAPPPSPNLGVGAEAYHFTRPIGIGADSENNIWVIGNNGTGYSISKQYRMQNNAAYPYGGICRYPSVPVNLWPNSLTNTKEVEWFLTRDPSMMSPAVSSLWSSYTTSSNAVLDGINGSVTQLSGITVIGATLAQQVANVYAFIAAIGTNQSILSGRLLYPYYTGFDTVYTRNGTENFGTVNHCRTGITGNLKTGYYIANSITQSEVFSDYIYPSTIPPTVKLIPTSPYQNSALYEPNNWPWGNSLSGMQSGVALLPYAPGITLSGAGPYIGVTGYDDQTINFLISANPGSFTLTAAMFLTEDINSSILQMYGHPNSLRVYNINSSYDPSGAYVTNQNVNYTFNNTSMIGNSSQGFHNDTRRTMISARSYFLVAGAVATYPDPYTLNNMQTFISPVTPFSWSPLTCTVNLPIPAILDYNYITVVERWPTPSFIIEPTIPQANWYGYLGNSPYDNGATAYGLFPVSAALWDTSIARTFPMSAWNMTLSASITIPGWTPVVSTTWACTTSVEIIASNPARLPADTKNSDARGSNSLFPFTSGQYSPGLYGFTLYVTASSSYTKGAAYDGSPTSFTQYLCVDGIPATSNWGVTGAVTVPFNYSYIYGVNPSLITTSTTNQIISGYAPNLTVYFADSAIPGTSPIQTRTWDFGDYYDQHNNTITLVLPGQHVQHTYTMPGTYNVNYCVQDSAFTQSCCARSATPTTNFYILVKEIAPITNFTISDDTYSGFTTSLTGSNPFTIYVCSSAIHTGSFGIGRIDYDFGDGSDVETFTRYPFMATTNNGTTAYNINAFGDSLDPRNYVIPHIYASTTPQTYNISLTAYADNTNTSSVCAINAAVTLQSRIVNSVTSSQRHLVKSRFLNNNDDMIYVFEDGTTNSSFTVVLSGD